MENRRKEGGGGRVRARTSCIIYFHTRRVYISRFNVSLSFIPQDLDEIAGPLLHRTADTNRFLRADSNAALDQMMQYLPPHKTIGIVVLRGARQVFSNAKDRSFFFR